jgi:hypothetical protein
VVNLAREHAIYDEEIKLSIYQRLSRRPLRFNDLVEALGRNRVTVSEYLLHGQKENDIDRDPKTKEYHLTEKGKEEIDRILSDRARQKAPFRYHGKVGPGSGAFVEWKFCFPPPSEWSQNGGDYYYDMAVSVSGSSTYSVWTPRLPLPVDLDASFYGSEEFREFFEGGERTFEEDFFLRPKKSKATILDDAVRPLAEAFFSFFLLQRFLDLLDWHSGSKERQRGEAPSPLTLESVLGFDMSVTIGHHGKERFLGRGVPSASEMKERFLITKRLVGALLLRAAYNRDLELGYPYVDLMQTAGWLDKGDAEAINRSYLQWKKEGDPDDERDEPSPDNPLRRLLYETGWRYLKEGGYTETSLHAKKKVE